MRSPFTALLLSIGMALGWGSPVRAAADSTLTPSASPNGSQIPSVSPMPVSTPDSKPTAIQASKNNSQADSANAEEVHRQLVQSYMWQFAKAALTPITFYGKVVDEKGNPIAGAEVDVSVADRPFDIVKGGTDFKRNTDLQGLFSISGVHGLGVNITASKKGYYNIPKSSGRFGYVSGSGCDPPHPNPKAPAILMLRKKGLSEDLIHLEHVRVRVEKDGDPVYVNFIDGKATQGSNSLTIQIWSNKDKPKTSGTRNFTWKAILSIPGGGLMEDKRTEIYNFFAPETGYTEDVVIDMPENKSDWRPFQKGKYFIRFPDGRYARAETNVTLVGYLRSVFINSYINPVSGHRNLEYNSD